MPIKFIKNIFGKGEEKKPIPSQPAPAPAAEPAPAKPIDISKMSLADINAHLAQKTPVERPLRTVMDEVSSQLIAKGSEPYLATGITVQDMGRTLTSDASPCEGFDGAVISAIEQLVNHCQYGDPDMLASALGLLQAIIIGRNQAVVDTPRGLLQLKYHAQVAQMIAQQGQHVYYTATVAKFTTKLHDLNQAPALDPMGQRRQNLILQIDQLKHTCEILTNNLGVLDTSIAWTKLQMESGNLEIFNIADMQTAIADELAEQRRKYEEYLRILVAAQATIEATNDASMEQSAAAKATKEHIAASNKAMNTIRTNIKSQPIYTDPIEATPVTDTVIPANTTIYASPEEEEPPVMNANFLKGI